MNITMIKKIKHIPDPRIRKQAEIIAKDIRNKTVKLDVETLHLYHDALNPHLSFIHRIKAFLSAQTRAGRFAKSIKDFALIFLPYGKQINNLSQLVGHIIGDTMPTEAKPTMKSKTIIAFGLIALAGILSNLGVIPHDLLPLTPDAQWVTIGSGIIGIILRLITHQPVNLGEAISSLFGKKDAG